MFGADGEDGGMRATTLRRSAAVGVLLVLVALAGATVSLVTGASLLQHGRAAYLSAEALCWVLFAGAGLLLLAVPRRAVPALVLAGALLTGLAGTAGPPSSSTDSARYNWDGIVQKAGISPYEYVPSDAALAHLRPEWLFPTPIVASNGTVTCPGKATTTTAQVHGTGTICARVNRPIVPTIYPPVAEALFVLARLPVASSVEYLPMQVLGLVSMLGTTLLLLRFLPAVGRDRRWAVLVAWSPFVTTEAVNNAHIDGEAAFFAFAATLLLVSGRRLAGGVVLGLAIATKFLPLLIVPPMLRRRPLVVAGAAAGTVALVYLPHVLAVGPDVIGYLPGYLNEEGYEGGTRSALLSWVVPEAATTIVAALLLAALAVLLLVRTDPANPWVAQAAMVGTALVLLSPRYAWYGLLLVPFIAMSGRWEWSGVVLLLSVPGLQGDLGSFRPLMAGAVALVVIGAVVRTRPPLLTRRRSRNLKVRR